ncbi:MAG: FAD-dependent oxidoreductase [Elusimicrobia bacterium]|nr:FAD-dependent oxidoreductase [Elusimicrobiota bacterium]
MRTYELIIVGAGPAGITAGIYAARKGMDFITLTGDIGGRTLFSWDMENYVGYQFVTGKELVDKVKDHIKEFNMDIRENEQVREILKNQKNFRLTTSKGEYEAKTVIIATGREPKTLNVKGEDKFQNKGITYCATCDAPLFRDKSVAVVGGGNSGKHAVLQLARIAKKTYLIEIKKDLTGDSVVVEKIKNLDNVEILTETQIVEIYGDLLVKGIKIKRGEEIQSLDVEGIFVEMGFVPKSGIINFIDKNKDGEIIVDCKNQTSYPGIFAAGDVTNVFAKQVIISCGEGAKAGLSAFEYINYV